MDGTSASADERLDQLDRVLLAHGGRRVARRPEPHAAELLARGRLFTLPVRMRRGEPNRCHSNAAALWGRDVRRHTLVTGYALGDDGCWRQHSWVVDGERLHETTVRAEAYFGVELATEEAARFWFANYLPERYPAVMSVALASARRATESGGRG